MLRSVFVVALTCAACSAGGDTHAEKHPFGDSAGRSCEATLERTSASAPSVGESVACDGEPKQCSKASTPCFELTVDDETKQLNNCPACCRGTASSFVAAECSALVCVTDADCVYARAQCLGGACVCPNGLCE